MSGSSCPTPATTSDGLLDTSVIVGWEAGRIPPDALPERGAISTLTIAELHLGVLVATQADVRARRLETLVLAERSFDPIPVSSEVARRFAELVAALRAESRRAPVIDCLIAATAMAHQLNLYTQDADFTGLPGLQLVLLGSVT